MEIKVIADFLPCKDCEQFPWIVSEMKDRADRKPIQIHMVECYCGKKTVAHRTVKKAVKEWNDFNTVLV